MLTPTRTTLDGHAPDAQRHKVALTFETRELADAALPAHLCLYYGGVMARRLSPDGRRVLVTSAPRYYGTYGYRHTNHDVARVVDTLTRRANQMGVTP